MITFEDVTDSRSFGARNKTSRNAQGGEASRFLLSPISVLAPRRFKNKMATGGKCPTHSVQSVNRTFETYKADSSVVEERLLQLKVDDDVDGPMVFTCGKCKLPVGDSLSWDGSEDAQNQIQLKRVSDNVLMAKDARLHEACKGSLCLIVDLVCGGCRSVLGMIYKSTPKNLDHKRYKFCFDVAHIDSYVLGSASTTLSAEAGEERPVTLEYRGQVERQLAEMKLLLVSMARHVEELESAVRDKA
ncbi:protein Mis18-alpha [Phycodurus eques]|uniref:protein Mis18-alpha n=1 Tax=Phycodurus eques TaxID=693459 RepID=UPI002ACDC515|nr:protein Mis18-alpha [Phycodurus eques]